MRRPNRLPEEPSPADPEVLQLRAGLEVLAPIRSHRQQMAERRWRRERQALMALQRKLQEQQTEYQQRSAECQQQRQELADEYQSCSISHESLKQWMGEEKQLLQSLEAIGRELHQLQQSLSDQEERVEEATHQVSVQQREAERLALFMQELEEAP